MKFKRSEVPQNSSFLDPYFKIRNWEDNGKIYEKIGIKKYKKMWEFYMRLRGKQKIIDELESLSLDELREKTKQLEKTHLIGGHIMIGIFFMIGYQFQISEFIISAIVSELIANIPPILLQRRTRGKIEQIIKRSEE